MTLRYPSQLGGATAPDYVQFVPMEYRSNMNGGPQQAGGNAGPGQQGAQAVILYMPNTTPAVGNVNNWGEQSFAGPIGQIMKSIGSEAANLSYGNYKSISDVTEQLTQSFQAVRDNTNVGGVIRQGALQFVGGAMGTSAGQLLALAQGKVYNPNVELLYTAPGMRSFDFSFKFVPKNAQEASEMNRIIVNFKKWSAPKDLKNGMFEVPHVWQVQYMTGGSDNNNLNKFKPAACTSVTVQANPQTTMHVAHPDGVPIETVMSLSFREVNIITRKDHDDGNQGY